MNSNSELRDKKAKLQQAEATASGALCGRLSARINRNNANHHLYVNGRLWWVHFTVHVSDYTKRRVRQSLNTANISVARQRRDAALTGFPSNPIPANTVKLPVAFTNTKFQVPINYYGSARRGIGAARSGPQFFESPVVHNAPRRSVPCSKELNNNNNNNE